MKVVSPLLKRALYPILHHSGQLPRFADSGPLAVLTYHGVLPAGYKARDLRLDGGWVTAHAFRSQLRLLRQRYSLVPPEQVRLWIQGEGTLPPRAVLLTCDDGLANAVSDMLPILQEENATCLFFVTADSLLAAPSMLWYEELYLTLMAAPAGAFRIDSRGVEFSGILQKSVAQRHAVWRQLVGRLSAGEADTRRTFARTLRARLQLPEECLRPYTEAAAFRFRLLTGGEIETLLAAGMSIGSHSISHPKLSLLPQDLAWEEISGSRLRLEQAFRVHAWAMAYPFGGTDSVSERELVMAEKAGYVCAFVNFGGGFGAKLPRYAFPRVHVTLDMSMAEFEGHLCGLHEGLRRRMGYSETMARGSSAELLGSQAHLTGTGKSH